MTSECYVYIVLPDTTEFVTAARFQISNTRNGNPIGKLIYGKRYLAREDAIEIDPVELKLSQNQYETVRMNGFFGAIRDAMPDFWGRTVIEHYRQGKLNEFDYLMLGPDDRAGALGFGLSIDPPAPYKQFNQTLDLEKLQFIAEAIINDNDFKLIKDQMSARQVKELLLEGTSMGGARPKAVIENNHSLWIAKFSSPKDSWNQPLVEHALLTLAKTCGLNVADSKMVSVAGKDVLLVRRFDRDKLENGYRRHRMVSALTLLKSDDNVINDREKWSYLLLADEIRRISFSPKADLHELFKRMCFNALVSNLDDHPRNHAVLAKNKNWQLSPAYDLTPTPSIGQELRFLAMECGLQGRAAREENLLSACERFFLYKEEAKTILDNMAKTIKEQWNVHLRRAGVSEKDCTRIASAFVYEGFFLR